MIRAIAAALSLAAPAFGWTLLGPSIDGWEPKTLVVYVNPDNCTISEDELYAEIDRSIAIWNQVPTSRLTMVRSPVPSTVTPAQYEAGTAAELPVLFCDPNFETSIGSSDVVPAATSVSVGTGPLSSAAIYLNAQVGTGAEISTMEIEQFRIALTHEMGHMLGLGHSAASTSLMYFSVSGKETSRITEDDKMGITYLYPRNELSGGAFGCASVPGSGTPWGVAAALAYLTVLLGAGRLVRSARLRALPVSRP
jgi:hypothetical protein